MLHTLAKVNGLVKVILIDRRRPTSTIPSEFIPHVFLNRIPPYHQERLNLSIQLGSQTAFFPVKRADYGSRIVLGKDFIDNFGITFNYNQQLGFSHRFGTFTVYF